MKKNRLLGYAKQNIPLYIIVFSMMIIQVSLRVVAPTLLARIIDEVIGDSNLAVFPILLVQMCLAYLMSGVFAYVQELASDMISRRFTNALRLSVFEAVTKQDGAFFSDRTPADLMSRTNNDTESVGFVFGFVGCFFIEIIAIVLTQFLALTRVSGRLSIVPLVCLPIIASCAILSEIRGDKINDRIFDKRADLNNAASEAILGIRTVKSFGKEEKERIRFSQEASVFCNLNRAFGRIWIHWGRPQSAVAMMMVPLVILLGGYEIIRGRLTLGDLTAAIEYTNELSWPMMEIGWLFVDISSARTGWKKVSAILNAKPSIHDGEVDCADRKGTMRFEHVGLELDGRVLLDDIDFELTPGKTVAIMGASGSGKSLVTSLAVRFLDPTSGKVTINGRDIRDFTLREARAFSSIVTQDVFLFSDTVRSNLALGNRKDMMMDDIVKAASDAKALEFIEKLEGSWDTVIGERGVGLSGGQKQRLSLARAFLRKNQLLILDDATSALDMETEADIERTIREEGSRSLLITAHRISAVCAADEILVLEGGRIAERGRHEDLLKKKGLYYQTYISQYPEEENA